MRAAGIPSISTVADPVVIAEDGPAHAQESLKRAAGIPPMSTVLAPFSTAPPTWGIPGGLTAGQVW